MEGDVVLQVDEVIAILDAKLIAFDFRHVGTGIVVLQFVVIV